MDPRIRIPEQGVPADELLSEMRAMKGQDADWKRGRTWSLVYHAGEQHEQLLRDAYSLFISENYLNPMAFRSLKRMETEVVGMSARMLHGGPEVVGTMSSGGTESIFLAVKASRDRARARRPWIRHPEMVVPSSIHVAFDKAAHYLGVRSVRVPVGPDFRADVRAMRKRISHRTVMLAASAPQYPQGVIDPIEELGQLALRKKLPFHVDACIGGFLLPWLERIGRPVPPFDFRVPGVSSISADLHKYGYASKGASVVLYRDMSYLRHQFFVSTDWTGGIYASATMPGTRPGGAIAAAWAALRAMGERGYLDMASRTAEATDRMLAGLRKIEAICVLGEPAMSLVAFAARDPAALDIYVVADQLQARGWNVDRQQMPPSIHLTVTSNHAGVIDEYLADLRAAVDFALAHPEMRDAGEAAMYGMMAKLPVRSMVRLGVRKVMEGMYGPDGQIPDLGKLGSDESDPLLKLADRYGGLAIRTWEKIGARWSAVQRKLRHPLG
ncbi:MAG: aspartate aminotransferase family protein [Deltaproteobacteria bacterium]|nr:aspartate aminotransferase family protein [Deltaproteobacteria bacterium]